MFNWHGTIKSKDRKSVIEKLTGLYNAYGISSFNIKSVEIEELGGDPDDL